MRRLRAAICVTATAAFEDWINASIVQAGVGHARPSRVQVSRCARAVKVSALRADRVIVRGFGP
jgi:hypothetical protein